MNQNSQHIVQKTDSIVKLIYKREIFQTGMEIDTNGNSLTDSNRMNIKAVDSMITNPKQFFTSDAGSKIRWEEKPLQQPLFGSWFTIVLFISLVLILITKIFTGKSFIQLLNLNSLQSKMKYGNREESFLFSWFMIPLSINSVISLSALIVLINLHFKISLLENFSMSTLFIISAFFLAGFIVLKNILIGISGFSFKNLVAAELYILSNLNTVFISSIAILPLIFLTYYSGYKIFLIIGLLLFSFIYIYKLFQLIMTCFSEVKYNLYYKFIYICTFEILPGLVFVKMAIA